MLQRCFFPTLNQEYTKLVEIDGDECTVTTKYDIINSSSVGCCSSHFKDAGTVHEIEDTREQVRTDR